MATIIKLITDWVGSGTSLTVGDDLFYRELTDEEILRSVLFRNPAGSSQDIQQRYFEDFTMQVIARADDYEKAETDALIVFKFLHEDKKALHLLPNDISPEIKIMYCYAIQRPHEMERDSKKRAMYINNYFFKILKP